MHQVVKKFLGYFALSFFVSVAVAPLAWAHPGVGEASGFAHGFFHPLNGLDHIMAMVAVGLWAAQIGSRAIWVIPLSFVSVMTLGSVLGVLQVGVPFVEQGIIASVMVLGLLIAAAIRLPLSASVLLVGLFAIFHGHAHGTEMPVNVSGLEYGIGFALATALLHLGGVGLGVVIQRFSQPAIVRMLGVAIALGSVYLMFRAASGAA